MLEVRERGACHWDLVPVIQLQIRQLIHLLRCNALVAFFTKCCLKGRWHRFYSQLGRGLERTHRRNQPQGTWKSNRFEDHTHGRYEELKKLKIYLQEITNMRLTRTNLYIWVTSSECIPSNKGGVFRWGVYPTCTFVIPPRST